jgi:hypothetical protein
MHQIMLFILCLKPMARRAWNVNDGHLSLAAHNPNSRFHKERLFNELAYPPYHHLTPGEGSGVA